MSQNPNIFRLIHLFLFCFLSSTCHADKPNKFHDLPFNTCTGSSTYGGSALFQMNLDSLFTYLTSNSSITKFNSTTYGDGKDKVYGQYMCLKYDIIKQQNCQTCVTQASKDILLKCPNYSEALVWEEECNLMYSTSIIIDRANFSGNMWKCNEMNISQPQEFKKLVNETLRDLTKAAAFDNSSGMYSKKQIELQDEKKETLYGAVQCGDNLYPNECNTCLLKAIDDVLDNCLFSIGARLLSRNCYLRYELYAFYDGKTGPTDTGDDSIGRGIKMGLADTGGTKTGPADTGDDSRGSGRKTVLLIVVLAVVLTILALAPLGWCTYNQRILRKDGRGTKSSTIRLGSINKTGHTKTQDSPFMDLPTICSATNFFSASNKLGQGGFGPVYKGILSDGKEVAIKRLLINSEHGIEEFTNEVLLIMKLQHKNLVKLLGFCAYEMEKILVYEYMPNGSLDHVLFDHERRAGVDWSKRVSIIDGIARGVLYLHEDSRLKIIHRDLKASNILLDSDMNPKISDFGIARILVEADAAVNTSTIVGTYGYMAPEYAMEGLYSKKSDVFSFGILLLEIITGESNASFHLSKRAPTLQAYAWRLFNEGSELVLLDPLISDLCHPEEFKRYMHIGLLCVQEDSYDRPTMSSVVAMLKSETTTLKTPRKPALSMGAYSSLHGDTDAMNRVTISEISPR